MRRIHKAEEPPSLAVRRDTPGGNTWGAVHGDERQDIRDALYREQHGLCVYCLRRLSGTGRDDMQVEHYIPRAVDALKHLHWPNLLGVCLGDGGVGPGGFHCDKSRKKKTLLFLDPVAFPPDVSSQLQYVRTTGKIEPSSSLNPDEQRQVQESIDSLNLNLERLKRNRKAVVEQLRARFRKDKVTPSKLKALLHAHSEPVDGVLPAFSEIGRDYLEKKKREKGW